MPHPPVTTTTKEPYVDKGISTGGGPFRAGLSRRDMLRRSALIAGGVAFGVPLLSACGGESASGGASAGASSSGGGGGGSKRLVVADWGGAIQDAEKKYLYDPFTEETGIEVVISGPPADAKIKAMVDSGNVEWDLVAGGMANVLALGRDYFEELPQSVRGVKGVDKAYVDSHAVAYYVFSTNIGWNTNALGSARMENWADFWDTRKFPGRRTLAGIEGGSRPNLEFALLADGVEIKDLYPLDVDRALAKMEELKPSVPQWWSSGAQPGQMLVSDQVSAASIWSGRVFTLQGEGAPIDFTWNDGMYNPAAWIVPKGAPNKDAAFQLAEYSLQPEVQARLWGNYPCGPTNSEAYDTMPEEHAKTLPTFPEHADVQFVIDEKWWGENQADVNGRWQEFLLS
jgi:putative spermidine/putrescine transport system substrate-binding protein